MTKYLSLREDFRNAVARFAEVLAIKEATDIVRDSAIKRFEIVFDVGWKCARAFLEEVKGVSCTNPRDCFRELFRQGIIPADDFWISITATRNYTVHTYSEVFARKIFARLPETLPHFTQLLSLLETKES